jgi:hypothetical protein
VYIQNYNELELILLNKAQRNFSLIIGRGGSKVLTPTKNLHEDKTIIKIGARVLSILTSPSSLSSIWESYLQVQKQDSNNILCIQFDTFILALDFLYMIGVIEYQDDLLWRSPK